MKAVGEMFVQACHCQAMNRQLAFSKCESGSSIGAGTYYTLVDSLGGLKVATLANYLGGSKMRGG